MYLTIRNLHLLAGLFCLAFLAMYSLSAVQMAHRTWLPIHEHVSDSTVALPAGITDARAAARELGIRGELTSIRTSPGALSFRIVRPGIVSQVQYSIATGEARIHVVDSGAIGLMNRLHHLQGMWHEYALIDVWSAVLGLVSFGLLLAGATGLYLCFRNRRERWIGAILLAGGSGLAAVLIGWMRG